LGAIAGDDSVWWINAALLPEGLSGEEVQFVWRSAGWRGVMAGDQGETFFFPRTQGSLNDIKWYPIFLGKDQRMQRKHVVILRDFVYNSAMCVGW